MAAAGGPATAADLLDWRFHRKGGRYIGRSEHRAELAALIFGGTLFCLLTAASIDRPQRWLLPIVGCAIATSALVAFDEARYHRSCGRYETALHRVLVGGHTVAFFAWLAWCLGRGAIRD